MTVIELTNTASESGKAFADNVRTMAQELASVQAGFEVHSLFCPSVVDLETGKHGIRHLIERILKQVQAHFKRAPRKDNLPFPNRNVYVAYGLPTSEIISAVRAANGFDKYPDKTIYDVLCSVMEKDNEVSSVQLTNAEDCNRSCKRPRKVWYLIAE